MFYPDLYPPQREESSCSLCGAKNETSLHEGKRVLRFAGMIVVAVLVLMLVFSFLVAVMPSS